MKLFKVTKTPPVQKYVAYIRAEDWEQAEERAKYDDSIEWEERYWDWCEEEYEAEEVEED